MLPHILSLIPPHEIYVEPFFGGGAVFFAKPRVKVEVINDQNDMLINFYRVMQSRFDELNALIQGTLHSESDYRKAARIYKGEESADDVWKAWAVWVQCNMSFGNKPTAGFAFSLDFKKQTINPKKTIYQTLRRVFEYTFIFSRDFSELPEIYNTPESFYYIDPPYLGSDCGHYSWSEEQEIELLDWIEGLKGKFLLSGYPNEIRAKYIERNGWHYKEIEKPLSVDGRRKESKTKIETLIWNYNEPGKMYSLF